MEVSGERIAISNTESATCAVCKSNNKLKRCSRCKVVLYCCRDHQKDDWIRHKIDCKETLSVQTTAAQKAETDNHARNTGFIKDLLGEPPKSSTDATWAEIESILDFSSLRSPDNEKPQTKEEQKEIFFELSKTDCHYSGPSGGADVSYTDITSGLCYENLAMKNGSNNEENADIESNESSLLEEVPIFNTHPFRRLKFPKPESYDPQDIAYFVSLRLSQLGYCILDDAIEDDLISGIISEVNKFQQNNEFCKGNTLHSSSGIDYRNDMIKWLDGQSEGVEHISRCLAYMDSIVELMKPHIRAACNIGGRTEAMLACYPEDGSYFRRHIDNESKDGRCITCTLYLNRDWDIEKHGGLMRMFPPKQDKPVDVPPLANRLLFFWSDGRTPHEIHASHRNRYSITVWYYDRDERDAFKVANLKRETEEIYERISAIEEERSNLLKMTLNQQIRNRAMEAVQALTPGELQALSMLIDHHPNPKEALTSMGISEPIQEALIVHLNSQDTSQSQ
ncbi:hypothetical protein EGW08_022236 [Elysia chlorotica]|uniref:hypoxia-inducible factor-proline dioxygenase n=1 Tax=Elysia chlorotica TaxID=188477 RepID=A0A3S0ZL88_ELYCH|nr:hypothetical protein EGW08_022236 [Elysia chlorotica]